MNAPHRTAQAAEGKAAALVVVLFPHATHCPHKFHYWHMVAMCTEVQTFKLLRQTNGGGLWWDFVPAGCFHTNESSR